MLYTLAGCLLLALVVVTTPAQAADWQLELLRCTNEARTDRGIDKLKVSERISDAATQHARAMRDQDFFAHINPFNGTSPIDRVSSEWRGLYYVGENIAAGYTSPDKACDGLMRSPGHRRNILNPKYEYLGVGIARGGPWNYYYVQDFAAR